MTVMTAVVISHVGSGFSALVAGLIPMLARKGGGSHRRWGRIFFWLMALNTATGLVLALYRPIPFLTFISVFSFYFAFRGYRALLMMRSRPSGPSAIDWVGAGLAFAGGAGMLFGQILAPQFFRGLNVVATVFGLAGMGFAALDAWNMADRDRLRASVMATHIGGMVGCYIAAVSAFSVVNFAFLPTTARWLWPSVIGTPLLVRWIASYTRRKILTPAPSGT